MRRTGTMELTKWEYCSVFESGNTDTLLQQRGAKGWEAVGIYSGGAVLMKRPCGKIQVREVPAGERNRSADDGHSY